MEPESTETIVNAQRRAVHEYRQRLAIAARARWGEQDSISLDAVLRWVSTTSTQLCCAPQGIAVEGAIEDGSGEAPPAVNGNSRKRVMPPPPPLPRAQWNSASTLDDGRNTVSTDTGDLPTMSSSARHLPSHSSKAAAAAAAAHTSRSAPSTPTDDNTLDSLRRRVVSLCAENAELERRCERLRANHDMDSFLGGKVSPGLPATPDHHRGTPKSVRSTSPTRTRGQLVANGASGGGTAGNGRLRVGGNAKARTLQLLRELRSKLAVVRTGVKALGASDLFHNAATLLQPFLQQHAAAARRMSDRAEFFEKTAQGMQAKLLSLPDSDSPEGYEVQLSPDGRSSALFLDTKTWTEFTQAFTATIDTKFTKVEDFANRGARSLLRSANHEKEMKRSVADLELRCGELESVSVDWECLAIAIASDAVFESVTVQPCKKLEFAALQKQLADSNDEVRVVCGVSGWFAKASTRAKATVWRDKRADTISRVEQLLSQELQHFMMNGPQRNSLRRKVLLLRELTSLLQRLRTDNEPLPAAAAIIASNQALPSGLALASSPAPPAAAANASGSTGTPTRPPAAARGRGDLAVSGIRGPPPADSSDRQRRPRNAGRASLPLMRDGSTPVDDADRAASMHGTSGVALPAVGSPGPRVGGGSAPSIRSLNVGRDGV